MFPEKKKCCAKWNMLFYQLLMKLSKKLYQNYCCLTNIPLLLMTDICFFYSYRRIVSRQIAVRGFLQFLRHFRVMGALPSSQASMSFSSSLSSVSVSADVHSMFNSSTNEALCLELLGVLRRCFSQQHEVSL